MTEITEKWARTAEPGPELDRVCAEWFSPVRGFNNYGEPIKFSTDWSAAGPLLEAMGGPALHRHSDRHGWHIEFGFHPVGGFDLHSPTPQLAIARACAVLAARGITRDDLEDRYADI